MVDCLVGGGGSSLGRLGWNGRQSQNLPHGGVLSVREPLLSADDGVLMLLSLAAVPLALALRKVKFGGTAPTGH